MARDPSLDGEGPAHETAETGPSRPVLRLLGGALRAIDLSGAAIVVATLTFMFFALLTNVVLRYFFGSGITWAYEIHAILFPWMVGGGIAMASVRAQHIAVTAVYDLLPARARRVAALLIHASLILLSLAVIQTAQPILRAASFQRLSETGIPQIWGYASLIYVFAAIGVVAAINILRVLLGGARGADPSDAAYFS